MWNYPEHSTRLKFSIRLAPVITSMQQGVGSSGLGHGIKGMRRSNDAGYGWPRC
jgi:hypothetical protein